MLQFKNPLIPLDPNNVEYIVLHHISKSFAEPDEIHQWHLDFGWDGFGYGEYDRKDGSVFIGRGDNVGAHCQGYNSKSYGIAVEGNYDEEEMPQVQFLTLLKRIKFHQARFKHATVVLHSKLFPTQCPGKKFPWDKIKIGLTMPLLKYGSTGDGVAFLQIHLNKSGFNCGKADGIYGQLTQKAVIRFQMSKKLEADGICGPLTWNQIL